MLLRGSVFGTITSPVWFAVPAVFGAHLKQGSCTILTRKRRCAGDHRFHDCLFAPSRVAPFRCGGRRSCPPATDHPQGDIEATLTASERRGTSGHTLITWRGKPNRRDSCEKGSVRESDCRLVCIHTPSPSPARLCSLSGPALRMKLGQGGGPAPDTSRKDCGHSPRTQPTGSAAGPLRQHGVLRPHCGPWHADVRGGSGQKNLRGPYDAQPRPNREQARRIRE
jgi:hypothetical protein